MAGTKISFFLHILVNDFLLKTTFGIWNSYIDAQKSSRSVTLKIHLNMAPPALLARVWVTSEEQKYSCCFTLISVPLPRQNSCSNHLQYHFGHSKLHNSVLLKYIIVLRIIRCNRTPSGIFCLLLLESSDFRCSRIFCEGTNAKINLILKEKNKVFTSAFDSSTWLHA